MLRKLRGLPTKTRRSKEARREDKIIKRGVKTINRSAEILGYGISALSQIGDIAPTSKKEQRREVKFARKYKRSVNKLDRFAPKATRRIQDLQEGADEFQYRGKKAYWRTNRDIAAGILDTQGYQIIHTTLPKLQIEQERLEKTRLFKFQ